MAKSIGCLAVIFGQQVLTRDQKRAFNAHYNHIFDISTTNARHKKVKHGILNGIKAGKW